jgi:hypothetical protein
MGGHRDASIRYPVVEYTDRDGSGGDRHDDGSTI